MNILKSFLKPSNFPHFNLLSVVKTKLIKYKDKIDSTRMQYKDLVDKK